MRLSLSQVATRARASNLWSLKFYFYIFCFSTICSPSAMRLSLPQVATRARASNSRRSWFLHTLVPLLRGRRFARFFQGSDSRSTSLPPLRISPPSVPLFQASYYCCIINKSYYYFYFLIYFSLSSLWSSAVNFVALFLFKILSLFCVFLWLFGVPDKWLENGHFTMFLTQVQKWRFFDIFWCFFKSVIFFIIFQNFSLFLQKNAKKKMFFLVLPNYWVQKNTTFWKQGPP